MEETLRNVEDDKDIHAYCGQIPIVRRLAKLLGDLCRNTNQVIIEVGGPRFEDQHFDCEGVRQKLRCPQ